MTGDIAREGGLRPDPGRAALHAEWTHAWPGGIEISRWSRNTAVFTESGYLDSASAFDAEIAFAVC